MLQKSKPTPQVQQWYDKLAPVVAQARATLREITPSKLALYSGCEIDDASNFRLTFFQTAYVVSGEDFAVYRAASGEATSSFTSSLILTYLATADGTTPSSRWIGFRDLPNGMFYVQAFEGYTGQRLTRDLPGGAAVVHQAAQALGGEPIELSDAGYAFTVLPRLHLALAYWEGDEEFPSQARVLFEDTAVNYMSTDGLAIMGSQLVGRLIKAAG